MEFEPGDWVKYRLNDGVIVLCQLVEDGPSDDVLLRAEALQHAVDTKFATILEVRKRQ